MIKELDVNVENTYCMLQLVKESLINPEMLNEMEMKYRNKIINLISEISENVKID